MGDDFQNFEWALKNGDLDQVKILTEKNKDLVNKQLSTDRTPLCVAADYGQLNILQFLVSKGAHLDVQDKYGISPLLSAIYEGHVDCAQYLIEKGASKIGKSPDGKSYLECADNEDIIRLLS